MNKGEIDMSEIKFKVGDTVKVVSDSSNVRKAGEVGIINYVNNLSAPYGIEFETADGDGDYEWFFTEDELELVNIAQSAPTAIQPLINNFIEIDNGIYLNKDKVAWFSIKPTILVTSAGNEEFFRIVFDYCVDNISSKKYNTKQEATNDLIKWGFINE